MRIFTLISGILFAIALQACVSCAADTCTWETSTNSKKFSFNLLASSGHAHGARSEDGFYKVFEKSADGTQKVFWFQLCEHMQFNYGAPTCDQCEACGGPLHCGETCSALVSTSDGGHPYCTTLGTASNVSYALLDKGKPQAGVMVKMSAPDSACSFSAAIACSSKDEQLPTTVSRVGDGKCNYVTKFSHSAGCPTVTNLSSGGMGWFATLIVVLLCVFFVYLAIGIGYRSAVLGVSGLEAIPNLQFWKDLPHLIRVYFESALSFVRSCYRRFTEPTYTFLSD